MLLQLNKIQMLINNKYYNFYYFKNYFTYIIIKY